MPDSGGDEGDANNFDEQKEKSLDIASKCKYEEEFIDF